MARPEKEGAVQELTDIFSASKALFLTDFVGLDVGSITELRKRLRDEAISYRVVKNTLARRAADQARMPQLKGYLEGPTGIAYTDGDITVPAKILIDFAKEMEERPKIKGGFAEGSLLNVEEVQRLAELPPREVLLTQALSAIQAPLSYLVGALQGIPRRLAGTLAALVEQRKKAEGVGILEEEV